MRLIGMLACVVGTTALAPALAQTQNASPPAARQVPLTETVQGIKLSDEYRWMEEPANKPELVRFVDGQAARTRAMLDGLPQRSDFETRISNISSSLARVGGYTAAGGSEMYMRAGAKDSVPKLYVRTKGIERLLVDPAKVTANPLSAIGATNLSPDGRTAAVDISAGGSEIGSVYFFDITTGKQVGKPVPQIWSETRIQFLAGGLVSYTQLAPVPVDGDPLKGMTAFVRPLVGGAATKVMGGNFAGAEIGENDTPIVQQSSFSPFAVGISASARTDQKYYLTSAASLAAGLPHWRRIVALADEIGNATLIGRKLYTLTAKGNSARTLQVTPLSAIGVPGNTRVLMTGSDKLILESIAASREGLYVAGLTEGVGRLFFIRAGTGTIREIKLPFEGTIVGAAETNDGNGITLALSGWTQNLHNYRVIGGKINDTGIISQNWAGAAGMVSERLEATSADGTMVPLVILHKRGLTGAAPTLLEGYGGYGTSTATPYYDRSGMAWLDKGGVLAYCGTRGGGERGRAWHEGGRGHNKPNAMDDMIACAKTLTARGIAPPGGPVSFGSSMAGTLIPTAALRDPTAFRAMVIRVGVDNSSRIGAASNGANQFDEMGHPDNPAQFADLVAMDAYQMIPTAKALPPSLVVIGMNDNRVAPWMSAKFVARAQTYWPGLPIYLRSDNRAGHGMGSSEEVRRDEFADIYAFAWDQETRP